MPELCLTHRRPTSMCRHISSQESDKYTCMFKAIQAKLDDFFKTPGSANASLPAIIPTRLIDVGSVVPPVRAQLTKFDDMADFHYRRKPARYAGYVTLSYVVCGKRDL